MVQNSDSAHCDVLFAAEYPRSKRHLLPEFYAIHLLTPTVDGGSNHGANWQGRKTKRYGNLATIESPVKSRY